MLVLVLLASAEDEPVGMAIPDVAIPGIMSPEFVIAQVVLEDGEGGVIVSKTRVLGMGEPLRLADTADGTMADGIEDMVLPASVQVVMASASPVSVVGTIPDILSTCATAAEPPRAMRNSREAMTAKEVLQ